MRYDFIVGEYYRLKASPDYSYVKILELLNTKPKTAKCEHIVSKHDNFGFIRIFNLKDLKHLM